MFGYIIAADSAELVGWVRARARSATSIRDRPMREFRVDDAVVRRETRSSAFLWATVFLLMVAAVSLFLFGGHESSGANLFALTVLGAVVGGGILACLEALHFALRQMVFVLESNAIVRKRKGYPEVKIAFSELESLREELGFLIVESNEPRKKIVIPYSVTGYEAIRTELSKFCQLSARVGLSLRGTALLAVTLSSWTAFLRSMDERVVIPAGAVALITLAFGSRRGWRLLRTTSQRSLFWIPFASAWLVAFLLIYLRVTRP